MNIDFNTCYDAVKKRSRDYDGVFYTGVSSTGIFCRPVCPAITPKPENCDFYPSAAAAMQAGYRPCLRCRPETAPNSPAWNGVKTTVKRAMDLIDQGALDEGSVIDLSDRLGVSDRYLRLVESVRVTVLVQDLDSEVLTLRGLLGHKEDGADCYVLGHRYSRRDGYSRLLDHALLSGEGRLPTVLARATDTCPG